MGYANQQMSDATLGTYVGTASGGNVKVCRKYTVTGEGVYLKCSKCSEVLILDSSAPGDYKNKGLLEQEVQDYISNHKHQLQWEVKYKELKAYPSFNMATSFTEPFIKSDKIVKEVVEPVKKTGRRFR